jgi:hypothetical protein
MSILRTFVLMKHHGEIVENAVRSSAYPISKLADKLGVTRQTVYNLFSAPVISWDRLKEIGEIINYDFGKDLKFPRIKSYNYPENDSMPVFKDSAEEINFWKNKYIDLLERYNKLLLQNKK